MVRSAGRNVVKVAESPAHPGPLPWTSDVCMKWSNACRCEATRASARDLAKEIAEGMIDARRKTLQFCQVPRVQFGTRRIQK